ncbi:MAG: hypothetical protein RMJ48_04020 [Roseiflexaceae bacterium]|nr:hypothetical protein [Roseiflexaceae bacterium]
MASVYQKSNGDLINLAPHCNRFTRRGSRTPQFFPSSLHLVARGRSIVYHRRSGRAAMAARHAPASMAAMRLRPCPSGPKTIWVEPLD